MYNLNAIEVFLKVADLKGFTAATKLLDMPKSKVSRLVLQLEEQLQVRLFERNTRQVRMTEAGELFYGYARKIWHEAQQSEIALRSIKQTASGLLRISASVSIGQYLLGPSLAAFIEQYPEVKIDLDINNRAVDLFEENFDVALRIGKLPDSSLVAKRLGTIPLKLYASKNYLKQHGMVTEPADLKKHKLLCMPNALKDKQLVMERVDRRSQTEPYVFAPDLFTRVNDFGTIHQLSAKGIGIAVLPTFMCHDIEQLVEVLPEWEMNKVPLHIIYPSHRGVTPKLRVFIDFVSKELTRLI